MQNCSPTPQNIVYAQAPAVKSLTYPANWPKRPLTKNLELAARSVVYRITEKQKLDLYNRKITTRKLAAELGVSESHLSTLFPGKVAPDYLETSKAELRSARKAIRVDYANRVLAGKYSTREAAKVLNIAYRSMAKAVQTARSEAARASQMEMTYV
jgi:AraC-like DNA-binding protein